MGFAAQLRRSVQYFYFLRFSIFVWLFPMVFALADMGILSFSTKTLSRGIFVPERFSAYACVAFFLGCKGFFALISGRIVVINGNERFADRGATAKPPTWMKVLLANSLAKGEIWPVVLSQIPAVITMIYMWGAGLAEGVLWWRIL